MKALAIKFCHDGKNHDSCKKRVNLLQKSFVRTLYNKQALARWLEALACTCEVRALKPTFYN
jgi:hypothetical protein